MINIVGGSGFIGFYFAKFFSRINTDFKIIDIRKTFPENNWNFGDVRNIKNLEDQLEGDTILHLAAEHKDNVKPERLYYQTNLEGAKNLCKIADKKNIYNIIFFSSVAIYKSKKKKNHYGKSKFQSEKVFINWFKKDPTKKKLIIIRPTAVVGDGNIGNLNNLKKISQKPFFFLPYCGNNRKSLCTVRNLVNFTYKCLKSERRLIISNYVDKPDLSVNDIIKIIETKYKKKIFKINLSYQIALKFFIFLNDITFRKVTFIKRIEQLMTPSVFKTYNKTINFNPDEDLKKELTHFL